MDVKYQSVSKFLRGKQFIVPDFQRGYDWNKNAELAEFLDDIESCMSDDSALSKLFLGTVLLDMAEQPDDLDNVLWTIIDGQQRITTIFILLIALRNAAKLKMENSVLHDEIQSYIAFSQKESYGNKTPYLFPSDTIEDIFQTMSQPAWDGTFD